MVQQYFDLFISFHFSLLLAFQVLPFAKKRISINIWLIRLDTCSGWSNPSKVVKLLERDHDRQLEDRPEVNKHFNFIKSATLYLQKRWLFRKKKI
jgi:hypothetical protein